VQKVYLSVNVEVSPFSTADRKKRVHNDRRIQELNTVIQRTFQEAILGHLHPRTEISIALHVLEQDGGMLPALVNAATLALIDAGIPMYDYVSACSTAVYDINPLLDPNGLEEGDVSFLTAGIIGKSNKISTLLMENRIPLDRLEGLIALTISGCHAIRDMMDKEVRLHGSNRLGKK
jgi:exosome complex component RRP41